jgi:putative two-component system response regulator
MAPHYRTSGSAATVLVVDDDESNRRLLSILLGRAGYNVIEAADGEAALLATAEHAIDLVLMDIQMPAMNGIEALRRLRDRSETAILPIILVTGLGAIEDKVAGLDAGATDFVTKPFEHAELLARVRAGIKMKAAFDRLEDAQSVLVALANAVEAKDPGTEQHSSRLAASAIALARHAELPDEDIEAIGYGAVLHDVGKIGVAEALLHKSITLTDPEWAAMRRHPEIGASIVAPLRLGRLVAPIVRGHHERWDGAGYPDGIRGWDIPVGARIVSIVDAYDAITNDRPYRPQRSRADAHRELLNGSGIQFDPDLVRTFIAHADDVVDHGFEILESTRGLRMAFGGIDRSA